MTIKWYAILMDDDDNDWGTGSYNFEEAIEKATYMGAKKIAIIEMGPDPICIEEVYLPVNNKED